MATFSEASKAKKEIAKELLKRKDILGVGVGYYNPKNPKEGAGIIIYSQKAVAHIASTAKKLPKKVEVNIKGKKLNIPVRVIKNDKFRSNIARASFTKRIRPVKAGYSIGPADWSGSGGIIAINYPKKNQLFLLSNNHVLNKNNSSGYSETLQPGGADGGNKTKDRFGKMYKFVKLKKNSNYIDGALCIPVSNRLLSTKYPYVGKLKGHLKAYGVGTKFIKVGRTTGLVGGRVESINTDVKVDYGKYAGLGEIQFENQTIVRSTVPISKPGDSGSVWINYYTRSAAAVNFAGTADGKMSISYPIHWAMQVFNTRVATSINGGGRIISSKTKNNSNYTSPLSKEELKSIKVL